jgi:putative transposase
MPWRTASLQEVFVVKRKRFSVEQIVAVLKQAELGMPVADVIRQTGISEQTFYRWKKQYAGMQSDQVRGLKQLQDEKARLKRVVADLTLDKAILQDVVSKKWSGPR